MPSDHRLHPSSFLFRMGGQLRELLLPVVVVIVTAGSTGGRWDAWLLVAMIPLALVSLLRTLSTRYRFDEAELVVRTGFVFRNERHIPYARIQNIDAIQNVFHRALKVAEVRVETGTGGDPEATFSVLPLDAVEEMRRHALSRRRGVDSIAADGAPTTASREVLLALSPRELLLSGFVENRSAVVIAAAFGLLWEFGAADRLLQAVAGDQVSGRGVVRQAVRALLGLGMPSTPRILIGIAGFVTLLLVIRLISMGWSLIKLYGFTLRKAGDDLRTDFGLLTRVSATIPLQRIQTVTIAEGPLHRLFGRVSLKVDTAGGDGVGESKTKREPVAPILRRTELAGLLAEVVPGIDLSSPEWQPPHPRAFRRELVQNSVVSIGLTAMFVLALRWWTIPAMAGAVALASLQARLYVNHQRHAVVEGAVAFRSGWLWRRTTIARFTKIQTVVLAESPFDRRQGMARVFVDTAGAGDASHSVNIPYLAVNDARRLHAALASQAASTTFRW